MKPRALLAYLLTRPEPMSRARVAGVFWPDVLDTSARASLRSALWSVRAALEAAGGGAYLVADRASAGLAPDLPRWIDAEEAERLLAAGDRASLERAVELAARPFLPEIADEWAIEAQDAWRERLVGALDRLADLAEAEGDMAAAIEWTRRALRHDRLREAGHRALIRRLADGGERAQAIARVPPLPRRDGRRAGDPAVGRDPRPGRGAPLGARAAGRAARRRPRSARVAAAAAPAPPLRGRDAELDDLRGALAAAAAGAEASPPSRARRGSARAASRRSSWTRRGGRPPHRLRHGPRPGERAALRRLVGGAARARRATPAPAADARWPAELALLCPAVESAWGRQAAAAATPDLERLRIFEAVVEALAWSARSAPTVVLLEDLHRADPASLALLGHAGRRIGDLRALVVVTRRPSAEGEVDRPSRRSAARTARWPRSPSARSDDEAIAADRRRRGVRPRRRGAARVALASGGNPLIARGDGPGRRRRPAARGGPARVGARVPRPGSRARARPRRPGRRRRAAPQPGGGRRDPRRRSRRRTPATSPPRRAAAASATAGWPSPTTSSREPARRSWRRSASGGPTGAWPRPWPAAPPAAPPSSRATSAWQDAGRGRSPTSPPRPPRPGASGRWTRPRASSPRASRLRPDAGRRGRALAGARRRPRLAGRPREPRCRLPARAGAARAGRRPGGARRRLGRPRAMAAHLDLLPPRVARGLPHRARPAGARRDRGAGGRGPRPRRVGVGRVGRRRPGARRGRDRGARGAAGRGRRPRALRRARPRPHDGADPLRPAGGGGRAGPARPRRSPRTPAGPSSASVALGNIAAAAAARGDFARCLELVERALPDDRISPGLAVHILAARAYALSRLGRHAEAVDAARAQEALAGRVGTPGLEATAAFDLGCVLLAGGEPGSGGRAPRGGALGRRCPLLAPARAPAAGPGARRARRSWRGRRGAGALPVRAGRARGPARDPRRAPAAHAGPRRDGTRRAGAGAAPPGRGRAGGAAAWRRPRRATSSRRSSPTSAARPWRAWSEPAVELGLTLADRAEALATLGRLDEAQAAAREAAALADETGFEGYRDRLVTDARVL